MRSRIQIINALLLSCLLSAVSAASYTFNICNSSQIFDATTMQCSNCPNADMIPNPNQNIPTSCICKEGFYTTGYNTCGSLGSGTCPTDQYAAVYLKDGSVSALSGLSCQACDESSYKNENGTGCIPCPMNMKYAAGSGCICSDTTMTLTEFGCFDPSLTSALGNLDESASSNYQKLKYLIPSCYHYKDLLSCSHLVNLCTYSLADSTTAECKFFSKATEAKPYLYDESTDSYYMPAGTFNKESTLNFKLITYLPTGNYVGEKVMRLPDVLRCGMPSYNSASLKVGNNIEFTCDFNFNYLLESASSYTHQSYVYELFLQGASNQYYQVAVYLDGASTPTRRFFMEDLYTTSQSIKVATSVEMRVSMNSTGFLITPQLFISYKSLSVQSGVVTPSSDAKQSIKYDFRFVYVLTTFWRAFIGILIAVHVVVLVQSAIRTYIGYLNRESPFKFFFYFFKFWSLWMFYFLLCISGYWFLFSKTTQDLYIFIPEPESAFYPAFYVLAGLMGFFRLLTVIIEKNAKLNIEVFMINWEKGQFKNSWREIFIINSLAEFYTHRTISIFWLLLVVMFFLVGLGWESHAAEVTHTTLSSIYYFNPISRVMLYFLGSSIFIVVGIVFKILRRISVIQWPYPFQDFVDYCNVTNISFFFMKKHSAEAYYIHASIPDRTEVTYKEINEAIRRGLNKTRSVVKEHAFQENQRMYIVYVCKELEDKFNNMLKKIEDEEHEKNKHIGGKHKSKQHITNPREQFVEKKLKPHLEVISREGSNRNKTVTESLLGMPPVDLRDPTALHNRNFVIFDDTQDIVGSVFPNGNEFEEIHTIIIIFLMFILATSSVSISAFLTYFVDVYLINGWVAASCRTRLEKMTRVKEGFML